VLNYKIVTLGRGTKIPPLRILIWLVGCSCVSFRANVTASSITTPQQDTDERTSEQLEQFASEYGFNININPEIIGLLKSSVMSYYGYYIDLKVFSLVHYTN